LAEMQRCKGVHWLTASSGGELGTMVCACGAVCLKAIDPSMMSVICHCTSCRRAGRAFDTRSPVAPIVGAAGGTSVVLWRTGRVVTCGEVSSRLRVALGRNRIAPDDRLVLRDPDVGDFTRGFWISIYSGGVTDATPPSMRVITAARGRCGVSRRWGAALSRSTWEVLGQAVDDMGGDGISQSASRWRT
jgi:hypothetical protein